MYNAFSTAITRMTGNALRRDSSLQVSGGLQLEKVKSPSYPDNDVFEVIFRKEEKKKQERDYDTSWMRAEGIESLWPQS